MSSNCIYGLLEIEKEIIHLFAVDSLASCMQREVRVFWWRKTSSRRATPSTVEEFVSRGCRSCSLSLQVANSEMLYREHQLVLVFLVEKLNIGNRKKAMRSQFLEKQNYRTEHNKISFLFFS